MVGITQRPWTPTKRRGPIAAEYNSPGPACVTLPSYIGKKTFEAKSERAPAFSFGARHNGKLESLGPGPGQYNVTGLSAKGKDTPPALSLHSRPKEPKPENFPAPGDYNPDKAEKVTSDASPQFSFGLKTNVEKPIDTPAPNVYNVPGADKILHEHSPQYSFGSKVNLDKPLDTPAPNVYNIPSVVGDLRSAPSYTISGRHKEQMDERVKNPGPGQYNNVDPDTYKPNSPVYTISLRTNVPSDHTNIPGPGVYCPERVVLDNPPAHSFGIRHSPYSSHY